MIKDITVILPIAGEGKRFWPLKNKHFLPFLGEPLLHYSLRNLEKSGFQRITLVVNRENKNLAEKLVFSFPKLSLKILPQKGGKGIGAAVLSAEHLCKGGVLILSPHDVVEESLFDKFTEQINKNPQALVAAKRMKRYFPGGYLVIREGKVKKIIEKPSPDKLPSDAVVVLFYYFCQGEELIKSLKKTSTGGNDQFERAVSMLLKEGLVMKPVFYSGFWGFLKYPWDILDISNHFLGHIKRSMKEATIHHSVTISGSVWLEKGVVVYPHASIVGPTYIGSGTVVGNNVLIRNSHISRNCVIGFGSELARSYVQDNCWFHTNYIGDSVIGKNVAMGAGGVLANFRLDEAEIPSLVPKPVLYKGKQKIVTGRNKFGAIIGSHVRIGVNASIMPGTKIGSNVCVGAGVVLDKDINDGEACFLNKGGYSVVNNRIDVYKLVRDMKVYNK